MSAVPDEYFPHFARGILDGDGTIYPTKPWCFGVVFYATHVFLRQFREQIVRVCGVKMPTISPHPTSPTLSRFGWTAYANVTAVLGRLYPAGDYLSLNRKRSLAHGILRYYASNFDPKEHPLYKPQDDSR